jgi:hypothetical protein
MTTWLTPPIGARNTSPATGSEGAAMYILSLTANERQAFDWVGERYNSGKVADLLLECVPKDREWGDNCDITFTIPEHIAWQINELAEEESYSWACFAPDLAEKLNELCRSIV